MRITTLKLARISQQEIRRAYGTTVSGVVIHLNLIHLNRSQILTIHPEFGGGTSPNDLDPICLGVWGTSPGDLNEI